MRDAALCRPKRDLGDGVIARPVVDDHDFFGATVTTHERLQTVDGVLVAVPVEDDGTDDERRRRDIFWVGHSVHSATQGR